MLVGEAGVEWRALAQRVDELNRIAGENWCTRRRRRMPNGRCGADVSSSRRTLQRSRSRLTTSPGTPNREVDTSITEQQRHRLIRALEQALGEEEAASLMEYLPPVGWADVATKRDLDQLDPRFGRIDMQFARVDTRFEQIDTRLDQVDKRFGQFEERLDLKLVALAHEFEAKLHKELRRQTLTMLTAIVAMLGILGALAGIF